MMHKELEPGRNVKCLSCGKYSEREHTFVCRKCRKSPFCMEHLDNELKVCLGCAAERRMKLHEDLVRQEHHTKSFLQLSQFILVIAVVFFAVSRYFPHMVPEFISGNVIFEYSYLWGAAALICMIFCWGVITAYRRKMTDLSSRIEKHKVSSRYIFR